MSRSAVLRLNCPDQRGIVAAVSDFIFKLGGNILHADEHLDQEQGLFLMRIEFDPNGSNLHKKEFKKKFETIADKFKMSWNLAYSDEKPGVAILVSKETHCLSDLLARNENNELPCNIKLIVSNHQSAKKLALFYGIPFQLVSSEKAKAERKILQLIEKNKIELIVLARYMRILSSQFVQQFPSRIINIHHSFLPAFVGAKPYHQAYKRGVKIIGATSHYVTADLDAGPIIEQDVVRISHRETVEDIVQKGRDLEKVVLSRAVKLHLSNKVLVYGNKTVVFN